MKRRVRRKSRRWLYWLIVVILVIVAAVVGYKVWEGYFQNKGAGAGSSGGSEIESELISETDEVVDGSVKEESEEEKIKEDKPESKLQYEGADPNLGGELTGVVTYAAATDDSLMIRVNIDQYLASGSCALTLVQDGAALYEETVGVIDSAATATCEGFNVPISKVNKSGLVGIRILVTSGSKTGIIEGEVNI